MNQQLCEKIKKAALQLGFDLCGFTAAKIEDKYLQAFDDWLHSGHHGSMEYMEKIEQRRDLTRLLPGAKSVVVLAMNYYREQDKPGKDEGIVARYAYGRDYHKIIKKKLKKLEQFIQEEGGETKAYVDTGPVLERALAEQAGIGRIGKNTCLITEQFGSWVFLSEIITTLELVPKTGQPAKTPKTIPQKSRWSNSDSQPFNVCGNCTKCVDSCPTGAIRRRQYRILSHSRNELRTRSNKLGTRPTDAFNNHVAQKTQPRRRHVFPGYAIGGSENDTTAPCHDMRIIRCQRFEVITSI